MSDRTKDRPVAYKLQAPSWQLPNSPPPQDQSSPAPQPLNVDGAFQMGAASPFPADRCLEGPRRVQGVGGSVLRCTRGGSAGLLPAVPGPIAPRNLASGGGGWGASPAAWLGCSRSGQGPSLQAGLSASGWHSGRAGEVLG